jgi:hypothetical protein
MLQNSLSCFYGQSTSGKAAGLPGLPNPPSEIVRPSVEATPTDRALEVVDLTAGKVINSLGGFKDTQDALFLGGDFNKLYVSSLDGHVRVF